MKQMVFVIDSNVSINGEHIIVALGKSSEKLSNGAILRSLDGKKWQVVDNNLKFQPSLMKLMEQKENEGIFFYDIQGIDHVDKPDIGQKLTIAK